MLFPLGLLLGFVVAWRREGWGGVIATGSFLAFYAWNLTVSGKLPGGLFFPLLATSGFLFLVCWLLSGISGYRRVTSRTLQSGM
ncbi:MAG: hypothetical protein EXR62_16640 [Chloroflexi bacterium]|nr:hypothetical protein [Chloroflexota bacterium]